METPKFLEQAILLARRNVMEEGGRPFGAEPFDLWVTRKNNIK
ncbi:hypothetical protein [Priestia abyssalis]|nr:hypothetical protein [Priestia abyssalis]